MSEPKAELTAAKARIAAFAEAAPELLQGFGKVSQVASRGGRAGAAQKELMAVAIAVVQGCADCILYHVSAAKRHGAEEADLIEALEVAVEMGGGPAVMYAGRALEAFRAL